LLPPPKPARRLVRWCHPANLIEYLAAPSLRRLSRPALPPGSSGAAGVDPNRVAHAAMAMYSRSATDIVLGGAAGIVAFRQRQGVALIEASARGHITVLDRLGAVD